MATMAAILKTQLKDLLQLLTYAENLNGYKRSYLRPSQNTLNSVQNSRCISKSLATGRVVKISISHITTSPPPQGHKFKFHVWQLLGILIAAWCFSYEYCFLIQQTLHKLHNDPGNNRTLNQSKPTKCQNHHIEKHLL